MQKIPHTNWGLAQDLLMAEVACQMLPPYPMVYQALLLPLFNILTQHCLPFHIVSSTLSLSSNLGVEEEVGAMVASGLAEMGALPSTNWLLESISLCSLSSNPECPRQPPLPPWEKETYVPFLEYRTQPCNGITSLFTSYLTGAELRSPALGHEA